MNVSARLDATVVIVEDSQTALVVGSKNRIPRAFTKLTLIFITIDKRDTVSNYGQLGV